MINKMLIVAALVLLMGMSVKAEPVDNPVQDPKAVAPVVQDVSHEGKSKAVKKEHKKAGKTAKTTGSVKAPEPKAGEAAVPTTNDNKKIN